MFIKKVVNHFPTSLCHFGYALCGFEKENYTKTFSLTTLVVVESILPTYATTFFVRERPKVILRQTCVKMLKFNA